MYRCGKVTLARKRVLEQIIDTEYQDTKSPQQYYELWCKDSSNLTLKVSTPPYDGLFNAVSTEEMNKKNRKLQKEKKD